MAMRRRSFLGMFGAAIAAPAIPMAAPASYSNAAFKVAVAHAKRFPVLSVAGLSKLGGLSQVQAEAMIRELASQGMVKLVGPSRTGTVRAASKILVNDPWGIARTKQPQNVAKVREKTSHTKPQTGPRDIAPWLAHLHDLCRVQGMTLSQRCFA